MTQQASGDVVQLVAAGVAPASVKWRGGTGLLMCAGLTTLTALTFDVQAPDGTTWDTVPNSANGAAATPTTANTAILFVLPACSIRITGATGGSAWAVGI